MRSVAIALLLLLLAVAPAAAGNLPQASTARAAAVPGSPIPAALAAPWAARAGYIPAWSTMVPDARPYGGTVTLGLTFWPSSPSYFSPPGSTGGRWTVAELADRFGVPNATYSAIEAYFATHGFRVVDAFADRLSVTVAGPAAEVPAIFGTAVATGTYAGRTVHFPTAVPTLPALLRPRVAAISGLSEGFTPWSMPFHALPLPATTDALVPAQGRTTNLITPTSIHGIYGLDDLYNFSGTTHFATGEGIALVLWGDGFDPSDLTTFFAQYYPSSFPTPDVVGVPVDGAPAPGPNAVNDPSQAPLELTLDLEWAGSEAPGATLYGVYAPDGPASNQYSPSDVGLEDALHQAILEPNVRAVSMSFATPDGADAAFQAAFSTYLQSALNRGIVPFGASGDNGGTDNAKGACTTTPQPEFPAASPDVIAVGGTAPVLSLSITGGVNGLDSEPAWKDSGGGFSVDYSMPSWQSYGSAGKVIGPTGERGIPDVAGPAAYNFLYFGGQTGAGNGTSFAAPMWAGILAEMDAVQGSIFTQFAQHLYSIGQAQESNTAAIGLADITSGGNCLGSATVGWDTASGWGSPRAGLLYHDLSGSYVLVNLSAGVASAPPGGTFPATVVVTNATTHAPIGNLTVNLTLGASGYSGPCGGTLSTASGRTNATGVLLVSIEVPSCYIGSRAALTATVLQGKLFGSSTITIAINLLGFAAFLAFLQTYPYNVFAFVAIMAVASAVGLGLGRRQRRRRVAAMYPSAAPAPGATTRVAANPPAPSPPPEEEGSSSGREGPELSMPAAPPVVAERPPPPADAAMEEPAAPGESGPAPGPAPETGRESVTCGTCGFPFDPLFGFCPRCGQYLPPGEPGPPASH